MIIKNNNFPFPTSSSYVHQTFAPEGETQFASRFFFFLSLRRKRKGIIVTSCHDNPEYPITHGTKKKKQRVAVVHAHTRTGALSAMV